MNCNGGPGKRLRRKGTKGDARRRKKKAEGAAKKKGQIEQEKPGAPMGEYVSNVVEIFYLAFVLFLNARRVAIERARDKKGEMRLVCYYA